jgi:zinc transport system substrate-binding protein
MLPSVRRASPVAAAMAAGALMVGAVLAACSASPPRAPGDAVRVVVALYPLQFVVEQVGGETVSVKNLVQPGAEPHDLELSPRQVADVADADLVVYLGGFQPAVDEAVGLEAADEGLDVGEFVPLLAAPVPGGPPALANPAETAADGMDPHLWLDPNRMAMVATAVAARLSAIDPDNARTYHESSEALRQRLSSLDSDYTAALRNCARREIVVSHAAFGYLADRYRLNQVAISGLEPEAEPTPQRLAEVATLARRLGATTVFFETLVSPAVAQAIASEVGARTAVLDPIEGPPEDDGGNYLSVMRSNLHELVTALACR